MSTTFFYYNPVHVITRKFLGEMTRKLFVTESHRHSSAKTIVAQKPEPEGCLGEIAACVVARVLCHVLVHKPPPSRSIGFRWGQ